MDDHELQLTIPSFVYTNAPTVAPGGGAELIHADWFPHSDPFAEFQPPPVDHPQQSSSSNPFDYSLPTVQLWSPAPTAPHPIPDLSIFLASPHTAAGLPVYSASGFDLLSILARIATRPSPRIVLGPVDLTCAFVVVDVRRYDYPVVYCSPSFCTLTGYEEAEVVGRNCRFLQAPGGNVAKGEPRKFTSPDAVNHLRKSIIADKECQTSIVNYKKNGAAFINLVTVIPVPGGLAGAPDDHDVAYQVGFQVDLTDQPNAILEKLRDGSYLVNYGSHSPPPAHRSAIPPQLPLPGNARDRKANAIPPLVMSKDLKRMLADPSFLRSILVTNNSATSVTTPASTEDIGSGLNHPLSMILLEASPDFIHVVSIKGDFQYVAPSVRRVLGYEADEMIGTSIADYAHPEDVIPLMRELKESSATGTAAATINESAKNLVVPQINTPRFVDLLFRAKTKMGRYVWVECRGRLLAEPGKGRKAIILSGRAREMMSLKWEDVRHAGGLAKGLRIPIEKEGVTAAKPRYRDVEQEVWGTLGGACKNTATFMSVSKGVEDVLGWTADELVGRGLSCILCDDAAAIALGGFVSAMRACQKQQRLPPARRGAPVDTTRVMQRRCNVRRKDGSGVVDVWFVLYRADAEVEGPQVAVETRGAGKGITPAALVYQIRVAEAETMMPGLEAAETEVSMTAGVPQLGVPPKSSSSSLAGAVTLPGSPQALPASASSAAAGPPPLSMDMFDELSTSRGSSWQYELQQLRIANLRLREELAALEAAEASNTPAEAPRSVQSQSAAAMGYQGTPYDTQQHRVFADIAPPLPPLYTSQPHQSNHHHHQRVDQHLDNPYSQLQYDYEVAAQPQSLPPAQQQKTAAYLHQPIPLSQYVQPSKQQQQQRGPSAALLPSPLRHPATPQEWNTGPPLGPGRSVAKRSWSSIDGA